MVKRVEVVDLEDRVRLIARVLDPRHELRSRKTLVPLMYRLMKQQVKRRRSLQAVNHINREVSIPRLFLEAV